MTACDGRGPTTENTGAMPWKESEANNLGCMRNPVLLDSVLDMSSVYCSCIYARVRARTRGRGRGRGNRRGRGQRGGAISLSRVQLSSDRCQATIK